MRMRARGSHQSILYAMAAVCCCCDVAAQAKLERFKAKLNEEEDLSKTVKKRGP